MQCQVRLAVALVLRGDWGKLLGVLAVVCSTYSPVNIATSNRDVLCPLGATYHPSVRRANKMTSRHGFRPVHSMLIRESKAFLKHVVPDQVWFIDGSIGSDGVCLYFGEPWGQLYLTTPTSKVAVHGTGECGNASPLVVVEALPRSL